MKKSIQTIFICFSFLLTGCSAYQDMDNSNLQLSIDENTTINDIVSYKDFEDFGQFLFPVESQSDLSLNIGDIGQLLPYHSHINTDTTIEVINYMKDQVDHEQTIFYDIYSEEEKKNDPSKENTGLFFFKGQKDAPFAIVSAGGGFVYVGSIHESFPHTLQLSKSGYNAFALQYRTGSAEDACEDLAAAIAFVFENSKELEVSTDSYSLWGGSAGARMAAYLGTYGTESYNQDKYPRPSTVIMQYTGHNDYSANDPATFAVVGENDGIASWRTMQNRIQNLDNLDIDTEFHVYPSLEHGFGLGIGTSAEGWIEEAIHFWEMHID